MKFRTTAAAANKAQNTDAAQKLIDQWKLDTLDIVRRYVKLRAINADLTKKLVMVYKHAEVQWVDTLDESRTADSFKAQTLRAAMVVCRSTRRRLPLVITAHHNNKLCNEMELLLRRYQNCRALQLCDAVL